LPMGTHTSADLIREVDEEIVKIQTKLISENDFQKLKNKFDNRFVNKNGNLEGIAENLATYYLLYGDVNLINSEIDLLHSITREEIRDVALKYLNPNQRLILDYVPTKAEVQN
jgi:zinc protease